MNTDIKIFRGDTEVIDIAVTKNGTAIDLTGASLKFEAKRSLTDADSAAVITKTTGAGITITNAAQGLASVAIDSSDTANVSNNVLFYAIKVKDALGKINTLASGKLLITKTAIDTIV